MDISCTHPLFPAKNFQIRLYNHYAPCAKKS